MTNNRQKFMRQGTRFSLRVTKLYFMKLIIGLITVYQRIVSPLKSPCCRFYPSCSTYAKQAIQSRGLWQGGWLALKRIVRCHPCNPGGYDPVE